MIDVDDVTIGMFARERYSMAAASIDALREKTPQGVRLVYIDGDTPRKYRQEIQSALQRFGSFSIYAAQDYLLPIQATNELIDRCPTSVLGLIQNDVFVHEGWLDPILESFNSDSDLDYISPKILEVHEYPITPATRVFTHFDPSASEIETTEDGGITSNIDRHPKQPEPNDSSRPRTIKHLEEHAVIGLTDSFRAVAPFPDFLNTREQIAMAIAMHHAGQKIIFHPDSVVTYAETDLEVEEIEHYFRRWDISRAEDSNTFVEKIYGIKNYKSSMKAVRARIEKARKLLQ